METITKDYNLSKFHRRPNLWKLATNQNTASRSALTPCYFLSMFGALIRNVHITSWKEIILFKLINELNKTIKTTLSIY